MSEPTTAEERRAIAQDHWREADSCGPRVVAWLGGRCFVDGQPWPCETLRLIEDVERLEAEVERLRVPLRIEHEQAPAPQWVDITLPNGERIEVRLVVERGADGGRYPGLRAALATEEDAP